MASRVLSWVYPNDIVGISVKDSTEALKYGFTDYNGIINIATTFREPLLVIIYGIVNKTKGKVSVGEILGGFDYIQHIMEDEFEDLKDYGIKDCVILKEVNIFCHRLRIPVVVVMTEKPYYRIDNFEGKYTGKRGKQSYKLKLNSDSTYEFSRRNIHGKAISPEISYYGNWNISDGEIILISSQDPATLLQGYTVSLDTAHLKIKSINTLTLPKGTWNNKKTITLKQQYDETDQ